MPPITAEVLERLRSFDTPTICNTIELFQVRPRNRGYMDGRIQAQFPEMSPAVGFAATATFRSSGPPREGDVYLTSTQQVERFGELDGPAIVVYQDLDDPPEGATFGEQMCTAYQAFGAVGLITSGAGRDLAQVRKLGFPVFTNGTICAHGYCHTPQIHVPVHVGGIVVYPNDLLHADADGVTTIPREIAAEVADAAHEFLRAEQLYADALTTGTPTIQTVRDAARAKSDMIQNLMARVSRKR